MQPVRAHKGMMMEQLRVIGRSGHSSDPRLGNSALDGMARVLSRADGACATSWPRAFATRGFEVPDAHAQPRSHPRRRQRQPHLRRVSSSTSTCASCRAWTCDWVRARAREASRADALAGTGLTLEHKTLFAGTPAHELRRDAALLARGRGADGGGRHDGGLRHRGALSRGARQQTPWCSGPAASSEAHRPDEFVRVDRLEPTVQMLQAARATACAIDAMRPRVAHESKECAQADAARSPSSTGFGTARRTSTRTAAAPSWSRSAARRWPTPSFIAWCTTWRCCRAWACAW